MIAVPMIAVPMTAESYLLCISRATEATELHDLRREIVTDLTLTNQERSDLDHAVSRRFSALNVAATPKPKARW